jgi:hypothetical protein
LAIDLACDTLEDVLGGIAAEFDASTECLGDLDFALPLPAEV